MKKRDMKKRILFSLVATMFLVFFISFTSAWADNGSAFQYVNGCGTLSTNGATYEMNVSLPTVLIDTYSGVTTCFVISANNTVFNMSNYSIAAQGRGGGNIFVNSGNVNNFTLTSSHGQPGASAIAGEIKQTCTANWVRGIFFNGVNNVVLDGVYTSEYNDPSNAFSSSYGFYYIGTNLTIKNADWVSYGDTYPIIISTGSSNILVENVTFKHTASTGVANAPFLIASSNTEITNLTINNFTSLDGAGTNVIYFARVANATIKNSFLNASSYAIKTGSRARNHSIYNNTIYGGVSLDIVSVASPLYTEYISIENNNIISTNGSDAGIYMRVGNYTTIKNNNISAILYGIQVGNYGTPENQYVKNLLVENNSLLSYKDAFYITSGVNNTFRNNNVSSYSTSINLGTSSKPTQDNVFENNNLTALNFNNTHSVTYNSVTNGSVSSFTLPLTWTTAFTITNPNITSDFYVLYGDTNNYLKIQPDGKMKLFMGGWYTTTWLAHTWTGTHRVVVVKNPHVAPIYSQSELYLDGVLIARDSGQTNTGYYLNGIKNIGYNATGTLDEFSIFSDAKNQAWASSDLLIHKGYSSSSPSIIHGWHFNEGTGTSAENFVNSSRNITFSGNATWNDVVDSFYSLFVSASTTYINGTQFINQPLDSFNITTNNLKNTLFKDSVKGEINITSLIYNSTGSSLFDIQPTYAYINSNISNVNATIKLYDVGTRFFPVIFRNTLICNALTSPLCTALNNLQTNANFSVYSSGNYTIQEDLGLHNVNPTNGSVLDRQLDTWLNGTINGGEGNWNATIYNVTDPNNNISLEVINNIPSGTNISTYLSNLPAGLRFDWAVMLYNGVTTIWSEVYSFFPNDEPGLKNVYATVNETETSFFWENEMNMEWVSLYLGNEWLELRSITSLYDTWSLLNVYPGRTYLFKWQTGDNLLTMSDMYNFTIRSYGWNTDMNDYTYRRMITLNSSNIPADLENYAVNLTFDENNFQWCTGSQWWDSCYPAFTRFNWTTLNDIRFYNDYDILPLKYEVTYANIPGQGGQSTQTTPDETNITGTINDYEKMYDADWNTYSVPAPNGTYYFNYTLPAGAKTNSMFRLYDGEWFWDGQLPIECYGGTKLRFKSDIEYNAPYINTYCQNNADDSWISLTNTTSAHFYETMMTWQYEAQLQIKVLPYHYSDENQTLVEGIDGDYDTRIWMYYGNTDATNNETTVTSSGILQNNQTYSTEEAHILGTPVITDVNDTEGRTATGTNISWSVDQDTDNRIKYATNPWLLDSTYYSSIETVTESFEHQYGMATHNIKLMAYSPDYLGTVSVVCSNPAYSGNYTINSSTGNLPVEFNIGNPNYDGYLDWNITYTENKSWDRNTQRPKFVLAGLDENTIYWYQVEAYGTRGNATSDIGTFTLGTPATTPLSEVINYTEDRPNKQVTVCVNVTDMNGESSADVSIQYFNQTDTTFKVTDSTIVYGVGVVCKTIGVEFGENLTFRAKADTIPTNSCTGTPGSNYCSSYFYDESSCNTYENHGNQCFWQPDYSCTGNQVTYCSNIYDSVICSDDSGCSWTAYQINGVCYDTSWNYYGDINEADCSIATGGSYYWYPPSGTCSAIDSCSNYNGDTCPSYDNSAMSSYCYYGYGDEANCNGDSSCSWNYNIYCYNAGWGWVGIYKTMAQCVYAGGYEPFSYSMGAYCSNKQFGACDIQDNSYCSGDALTCEGQTSDSSCGVVGGCAWTPTGLPISGFSNPLLNLFDNRYEWFVGNPVEDDQMYLDRQYCEPNPDGTVNESATCYEEKGFREGSSQEETSVYIETNLSTATKVEKIKYLNGTQRDGDIMVQSIANYSLSSANGIKYTTLTGLDSSFYTFKVYDNSNNLLLNWVKPSLTHKANQTRKDESAFISFAGTPAPLDYNIYYFKVPGTYNTSAYQWCQAQPGGNLYDCMSVQYWGTSGMSTSLTGTKYDRGQLFRGGIMNGEPADTGIMQSQRMIDSVSGENHQMLEGSGDERFCYAFTVYYFDDNLIPTNNITSYYARYWREDRHFSQYLGVYQDSEIDQWNLFNWEFDDVSMTRDWKEVNGTALTTPQVVKTVDPSVFNSVMNQSLIVGYQDGFNMDVSDDKIYKSGVYFDGQWINQQIGLHQQGFLIVNLPDNATLQGLDTDSDGLTDFNELFQNYTNPFSNDTDEDTMLDGNELALGYDPNLYTSVADCESVLFDGCVHTKVTEDYTLNNTNAISVTVQVNVTNALLHNGSAICNGSSNDIKQNNGILSITIPANSVCYVLDNYDIKDSNPRTNDASSFTYSLDDIKKIDLSIDRIENVNISFYVVGCDYIFDLRLARTGYQTESLSTSRYNCSEDIVTIEEDFLTRGINEIQLSYTYGTSSGTPEVSGGGVITSEIPIQNVTNQTEEVVIVPLDQKTLWEEIKDTSKNIVDKIVPNKVEDKLPYWVWLLISIFVTITLCSIMLWGILRSRR